MATQPWDIDVTHSSIGFSVRHMVISKVRGAFTRWTGAIDLDPTDLRGSSVEVRIETASIDTKVGDRDQHLRSADFFDVANHPEIVFRSRRVEQTAGGLQVTGDLTMHGVTREVVLEGEFSGTGKDPWGNERAGFSAVAVLDRRDFGLTWNAALEAGGVLVGEKVEIALELEAVKRVAAATQAA